MNTSWSYEHKIKIKQLWRQWVINSQSIHQNQIIYFSSSCVDIEPHIPTRIVVLCSNRIKKQEVESSLLSPTMQRESGCVSQVPQSPSTGCSRSWSDRWFDYLDRTFSSPPPGPSAHSPHCSSCTANHTCHKKGTQRFQRFFFLNLFHANREAFILNFWHVLIQVLDHSSRIRFHTENMLIQPWNILQAIVSFSLPEVCMHYSDYEQMDTSVYI